MSYEYLTEYDRCQYRTYHFPVVVNREFPFDMSRVHPYKQREVEAIYDEVINCDTLVHVWVFGSSLNTLCNASSDLDIAYYSKYCDLWSSSINQDIFTNGVDYVRLNTVLPTSDLCKNIRKGLKIK